MKKPFYVLIIAGVFAVACQNNADDAALERSFAFYGDTIDTENAITPAELLEQLKSFDSVVVTVEAPIEAVCQKKGCWMDLTLGNGQYMTVKFKDYGFFVPMNASEKTAIVSGYAKVDTLDVDWLKHKAYDAGMSQAAIDSITEPEVRLSFMAHGVAIENATENKK